MPTRFIYPYVFLTGSAILALEVAASRLMAPYFGTSLFVWGNILGIVLGALAVGYYFGGRLADASPHIETLGLVTWVGGVLVALIPLLSSTILSNVANLLSGVPFFVIFASFFGMMILFAIPLTLLGALTPLAVRIAAHDLSEVGRVSGALSAASTAGSLLGAFLPSFVLIPVFGTRTTILAAGVVLILLGTFALGRPRFLLGLLLPAVIAWSPASAASAQSRVILEEESPYQHIRVVDAGDRLHLIVNEGAGVQTVSMDENGLTGTYTDVLSALPALFSGDDPLDILVIGVAGGSVIRQFRHHFPGRSLSIDAVEIDPVMFRIAEDHFSLTEHDAVRIVKDGRRHLSESRKRYDLIVIDAYREELYVPFHLTTKEFFALAAERLSPRGLLAMNILGEHDSGLLTYLGETARSVFPYVSSAHLPGTYNNVILASTTEPSWTRLDAVPEALLVARETFSVHEDIITTAHTLTDDRAPVEYLTDRVLIDIIRGTVR